VNRVGRVLRRFLPKPVGHYLGRQHHASMQQQKVEQGSGASSAQVARRFTRGHFKRSQHPETHGQHAN
jgi:hypothetical protein